MTLSSPAGVWIIGYGSLIFKPPPHVTLRVPGYLTGFVRRFWQKLSDHRGTPESQGRVLTLVSCEDWVRGGYGADPGVGKVWGVAYYVPPQWVASVMEYLDEREQDGYTLHRVEFVVAGGEEHPEVQQLAVVDGKRVIPSTVYIGTVENPSFGGPEEVAVTAGVIRTSQGASGRNDEYLFKVVEALGELGVRDAYMEELVAAVKEKPREALGTVVAGPGKTVATPA